MRDRRDDPDGHATWAASLLRTSALLGGACAFLVPAMPAARAACTIAVTGSVSCTGTTTTRQAVNLDGDPAGASDRTQSFDNGASIDATIARGAIINKSGLRLTEASGEPRALTLHNDGNVTNAKAGQTLRLDGNGGAVAYAGNGRITHTGGKGTAFSLDNVGLGAVSATTGGGLVSGARAIAASTADGTLAITTGAGQVSGTAGQGITATTTSGAITITTGKGSVSGTGAQAISTATAGGDTTITMNGAVRNGGKQRTKKAPSAVLAVSSGAGDIVVGGSGTVTSTIGRGIWAQEQKGGTGGILITGTGATHASGALCPGGHPVGARRGGTTGCSGIRGLIKDPGNASDVVINRSGTITASSAAINGITYGNGNILVTPGTNARVSGYEFGVEALSAGTGSISVTKAGDRSLMTTSGTGILAQNAATAIAQSAGSRIDISNAGTISTTASPFTARNKRNFDHTDAAITAGYLGGAAPTANANVYGTVTVANAGTLRAEAGDGIQAFNLGSGKLAISNSGTITASTGIALTGSAGVQGTITNSGDIQGRVAAIDLSHAFASTLDQQGGTIRGDILLSATGDTVNVTGGAIDGRIVGNSAANGANAGTVDIAADTFRTGATIDAANINVNGGTLLLANQLTAFNAVTNKATVQVAGLRSQTINGNYVQTGGATLAVSVGPGRAGQLVATKTADLSGTLDVIVRGGVSTTRRYTILTADGGVSGQFTSIVPIGRSALPAPTLTYTATSVVLTFSRTGTPATVATSAAAPAPATRGAASAAPLVRAVLAPDAAGARAAFAQLSGDIHSGAVTAGFEDTRLVREAILNRLEEIDPSKAGGAAFWGRGFGDFGRNGGDGTTLYRSTGGFVIGGDTPLSGGLSAWRLGFAGAYTQDTLKATSGNASGSLSSGQGAVYAGARYGAWDLRLAAAAGGSSTTTSRTVAVPGFADADRASYAGWLAQGFGEIGYRYGVGRAVLEPLLTGAAIHIHEDGFAEQGGIAALTGSARGYDLGTTTLGLRAETPLMTGLPLIAHAFLGWRHAYGDVDPNALVAFSTGSPGFAAAGVPIDRDALSAQAGLDWRASSALTLGLAYSGQVGARAQDEAVRGKLEYAF